MADTSLPARFAESDFRVGRVLNRTTSVLSRNFLPFFVVTAVAHLPSLLVTRNPLSTAGGASTQQVLQGAGLLVLGLVLMIVLSTLSQAVVLYGAFQDMRGRQVNLTESLQVGLRRLLPIFGLAICMAFLGMLAFMALVVPAFIVFTRWFVATPVCVVEQAGPLASMKRSSQLTKGHRWKVFGLMILLIVISAVGSGVIASSFTAIGGTAFAIVGDVLWNGIWGAFYAIAVVVTYHDLRVAKEGIDIDQIASVFD
jgi:hypothetical protein